MQTGAPLASPLPYHALPRLHALIKSDLPEPSPSQWAAYKEIYPAWRRQLQGQDYFLLRALPPTARPYRPELHTDAVNA
jgi:fatty acid desaturase